MQRLFALLAAIYLPAVTLLAQADPEPVNSPQRQVTYADEGGSGFIWIGIIMLVLIVVLIVLRQKNGTRNRVHRTNN